MSRLSNFSGIQHNWTTNLPVGPGTLNSVGVKTLKQIVNINTAFRDDYTTTSATDFIIKLPYTLRKVISMKLYDFTLPLHNYTISSHYYNNNFIIIRDNGGSINDKYLIDISDGMYTFDNINALEENLTNTIKNYNDISDISVTIDPISFKTTISSDTSTPFKLDFSYKSSEKFKDCSNTVKINNVTYKDQLTLGWLLGFRGNYIKKPTSVESSFKEYPSTRTGSLYTNCMSVYTKDMKTLNLSYLEDNNRFSYTSEGLIEPENSGYLLLSVDDFQNNNNTLYMSPFKEQSTLSSKILGKLNDSRGYLNEWPSRIYFGPTDIDKLGITIYDGFGRIYNNNFGDYSFELLVEMIYDGK